MSSSYENQSIILQYKSTGWFVYDKNISFIAAPQGDFIVPHVSETVGRKGFSKVATILDFI